MIMNSRQYEKMRKEALEFTLNQVGITEYKSVSLSADHTEYEVTLNNGTTLVVPSGFEKCDV